MIYYIIMIEIWTVDDLAHRRAEVARAVELIDADAKLLQFEKAQDALDELKLRASNNSALPKIIVLDRNLNADKPPYDIGEFVVAQIKSHPQLRDIIIVARSAMPRCGKDMVAAGANIAISKNKPEKLTDYISNLIKN